MSAVRVENKRPELTGAVRARIAAEARGVRCTAGDSLPLHVHVLAEGRFVDLVFARAPGLPSAPSAPSAPSPASPPVPARVALREDSDLELELGGAPASGPGSAESLARLRWNDEVLEVGILAPPAFLAKPTSTGRPRAELATVHGGHLVVSIGGGGPRAPWGALRPDARRGAATAAAPAVEDVLEVIEAAFLSGAAEHVHLQWGLEWLDVDRLAGLVGAIKDRFNALVGAELPVAPARDELDLLYAEGLDGVSLPLGAPDAAAFAAAYPDRAVEGGGGYRRMREAIARAGEVFMAGSVAVSLWGPLVSADEAVAAAADLAALGVVPLLWGGETLREPGEDPDASAARVHSACLEALAERGRGVQLVENYHVAAAPMWALAGTGAVQGGGLLHALLALGGRRRLSVGLASLRRRLRVRRVAESFDSSGL